MLGVDEKGDKAELPSEGWSSPTFMNSTEIKFPRSPARSSDGASSPPGLNFSWARMVAEREGEDEENDFSPPLWRPGSSMSSVSHPMSIRAQEIARGRQELMKLYEGMPESAYELSLKDLVDQRTAMDKQRANSEGPNSPIGGSRVKKAARAGGNKSNYQKHVMLNIFVPTSLTVRPTPPPSRPLSRNSSRRSSSDQNGKNHSKQMAKPLHHRNFLMSLFRIRPPKAAELSHCNSFSKVSPGPYSGQSDSPFISSPIEAKPNNSRRCSACSGYTVFFKTNCQACEKTYCSNCVKEAIVDTPEGRRCRATCMDKLYDERDLEPQMKGCWPSFSKKKGKSARRTKFSFREEDTKGH
ncbi:uncharacterized protein LOC131068207 [Cryptomeria japonica]|uniref:uncharacterized protein LOC131068207 n=1 Tax=Cryptomeria japonica TaxID=3369 RepID=UPI0027DA786F|nr:uncharacterized protein LOC131068207 [Cryptomeria japonica]